MTVPAGPIEFTEAEIALILGMLLLYALVVIVAILTAVGVTPLGRWWSADARSAAVAQPMSRFRRCWFVTNALLLFVGTTVANQLVVVGVTATMLAIAVAVGVPLPRWVAWALYLAPAAAVGWQIYVSLRLGAWFELGPLAVWLLAVAASVITAFQGTVLAARNRARRYGLHGLQES